MTDEQIIDKLWKRNEDAIAEINTTYGRKLRGLSNQILHNRENAEEIVSDTYMKIWETIPSNRPRYLYAYMAAICRHLSLNLLNWNQAKKRNAEIIAITDELELCIPDSDSENTMRGKEIAKVMDAFLENLPKDTRIIFLRRYWYADSITSIAKRYSMTESKVKMQLLRTRNKLKVYLEQEGVQI